MILEVYKNIYISSIEYSQSEYFALGIFIIEIYLLDGLYDIFPLY